MLPFGIGFKKQAKTMAIPRFLTRLGCQTTQTGMNIIDTQFGPDVIFFQMANPMQENPNVFQQTRDLPTFFGNILKVLRI
jgi:hypothetical protein